jgi:hypothetical protein
MAGTGFGFGWVALLIDHELLESKGPHRGPGVERKRARERDHDGGAGGRAPTIVPQCYYVTNILLCQVNNFGPRSICVLILLIRLGQLGAP